MSDNDRFKVGGCYFLVGYCDQRLTVPRIRTLIFIGKKPAASDPSVAEWHFGDPIPIDELGTSVVASGENIFVATTDVLGSILDWQGLINELSENKKAQDRGENFVVNN